MSLELVPMDLQILIVVLVAVQWAVLASYAQQRLFYYFWAWGWLWLAALLVVARAKATGLIPPVSMDFLLVFYTLAAVLQVCFFAIGSWLLVPGRRIGVGQLAVGLGVASVVGVSVGYFSLQVDGEEGVAARFILRALFLTAVYSWTGWLLLRSRPAFPDVGQALTSVALLLLAAHFAYYSALAISDFISIVLGNPLLSTGVDSVNSPLNFAIDVTLISVVAIGSVLMIVKQLVQSGGGSTTMPEGFPHAVCQIGNIQVDLTRRTALQDGKEVPLSDLSFRLLGALIRNAPDTVTQDALMEETWGTLAVSDETLKQRVWLLRKKLGDRQGELIRTDRGRGYRLAELPVFISDNMRSEFRRYAGQTSLVTVAVVAVVIVLSGPLLLLQQ